MKKALKWSGIVLVGLTIVVAVAAIGLSIAGASRLNKTHAVQAESITIPTDEAALARGEHLVDIACKSCHGTDLSGQPMMDQPPIATIYAANISGLAATHSDADLVRAIRHGVDTDDRQLMIMPAESFVYFSEEDLGSIIAYLKTVPRAGEERPTPQLGPVGRILMGAGLFGNMFPAEYIDHTLPFPQRPEIGANFDYGEYATRFCQSCHGAELNGGQPPDPESPPAPSLAVVKNWSDEEFINTMRTGVTPDGRHLNPAFMPWNSFGKFDDDELRGIHIYLESLPEAQASSE